MSHKILEKEWEYLEDNLKDGLSSKSLPFETVSDIRIGLDQSMHILVKSESPEERKYAEIAEGLGFSFRNITIGNETSVFFDLACEPEKKEILLFFMVDFIRIIDDNGPEKAFFITFQKWRKYWSGKKPRLSPETQRGLIGELLVLQKLISMGSPALIENWKGPDHALRDFEFERMDLEVKTTIKDPPVVLINHPEQISPGTKTLYLLVVQLLPLENGFSLPDVVRKTRKMLHSNSAHLEKYFMLLRAAGYLDSDESSYLTRYREEGILACPIEDTSCIMDPQIMQDVPSTVKDIRYNLLISRLERIVTTDIFWSELIEKWV